MRNFKSVNLHLISLVFAAFFVTISGCSSNENKNYQQFEDNFKKWRALGITDYQMTTRKSCFCIYDGDIVVIVKDSAVSEAFFAESGEYLNEEQIREAKTIEQYFEIVRDALDTADKFEISYNKEFGFPDVISIDYYEEAVDDEVTHTISDFQ